MGSQYSISYTPDALGHLKAIERRHHSLILATVQAQLAHEPLLETSNRKPLLPDNLFGEGIWEIRFGPNNRFRVFYRVENGVCEVLVVAIGEKERTTLRIGGKVVKL